MPKAFEGEHQLRQPAIKLEANELTAAKIDEIFLTDENVTLQVRPAGLPPVSLGYVANVQRTASGYEIHNIQGSAVMRVNSAFNLCQLLRHFSGTEYVPSVQRYLAKVRTEIGSTGDSALFTDDG